MIEERACNIDQSIIYCIYIVKSCLLYSLVYTYIAITQVYITSTLEIFGVLSVEYNKHHWCDRVKLIKMIFHFVYVNFELLLLVNRIKVVVLMNFQCWLKCYLL